MKSTDIALVLFMNIAFGAAFISAKIGVSYFPPFLFTSMRFLIIAVLLLPFLKLHQGQMFNILFISSDSKTSPLRVSTASISPGASLPFCKTSESS